jgi:magnesium transporter
VLTVYSGRFGYLRKEDTEEGIPSGAVWLDLLEPQHDEKALVEKYLGIEVPTREEMEEIEVSSRLYHEDNATFMTATLLSKVETDQPEARPVTFILSGEALVTVRYSDPRSFVTFVSRARRPSSGCTTADAVILGLLEAIVDRTADVLERVGREIDSISREIFEHDDEPTKSRDFQEVLRHIGREGDLDSKARESLLSIGRLVTFLSQVADRRHLDRDMRTRVETLSRDTQSLTDHATFVNNKINFLLDATLGMINIEQNTIIKIFSVAAVVFLPPTLIASIYGMNFHNMPELDWLFGYPWAIALMIGSAALPYWFFKRRGWL